jgi:hypothetical protein
MKSGLGPNKDEGFALWEKKKQTKNFCGKKCISRKKWQNDITDKKMKLSTKRASQIMAVRLDLKKRVWTVAP